MQAVRRDTQTLSPFVAFSSTEVASQLVSKYSCVGVWKCLELPGKSDDATNKWVLGP